MTTEYRNVKEFLSTGTGTEGSLLIVKQIHDMLVEEVDKALIPRSEAAMFFGPAQIEGSSLDVDLEVVNKMDIREVPESAEIALDQSEYTSFNLKPKKYGIAIRITREMLEDAKWNLLVRNIQMAGKRFAEKENSLIISDALDNASNTVGGGATVTVANLTRAMQHLDDLDYNPSTLFVGMAVLNDLRNIDTFVEFEKVGNREMLQSGFLGTVYGMKVIKVSTNAGMTTTTAYVTDKMHAYVIAEKRPLTVENFDLPTYDMTGAAVTQRLRVRQLRADAIAKITSS